MSEEYTAEAQAERASAAAEQQAADMQEALSIKYVLGLRLALLSSGNWAIYWGGPAGVREITVVEALDPEQLKGLAQIEVAQRAEGQRLLAQIAEYKATSTVQSSKSLEDMGL